MSQRQLCFALIRAVVVVALVISAARLIAIAYVPQWFAPRLALEELKCPPVPDPNLQTVASPPAIEMAATSGTTDKSGNFLVNKSTSRLPITKQEQPRSTPKKPPVYASPRKAVSPVRPGPVELAKREGHGVNQQTPKPPSSTSMLAQSRAYASPFGDMHGQ